MDENNAIRRALATIAEAVEPACAKWLVGGSAGLMLRGLPLAEPPRDLDLYADIEAAERIHERLKPFAIDEPELDVNAMYRSVLSHYVIGNTAVELVGGFEVTAAGSRYRVEVETVLDSYRGEAQLGRHRVGIVPLAHELWFNVLREREDRIAAIAEAFRMEPAAHIGALAAIENRNSFTRKLRDQVHERINLTRGDYDER